MFTGIIKEIGKVKSIKKESDLVRLEIECPKIRPIIGEGDSVSIDGCDLTATKISKSGFLCDATKETLSRTTLGNLKTDDKVNLEPSLTPSTPISGHFVLGHIDGVGAVKSFKKMKNQAELTIAPPKELMKFIAEKGSITVLGVGLTVTKVTKETFSCWIIPFTLENTTLGNITTGSKVNIEVDVIARYVVCAIENGIESGKKGITEEYLREHGFG